MGVKVLAGDEDVLEAFRDGFFLFVGSAGGGISWSLLLSRSAWGSPDLDLRCPGT